MFSYVFRDCNILCPADASTGNGILTKATVPIYATGVLTCYNQVGASRTPGVWCLDSEKDSLWWSCLFQEEDRKLLIGFLEDVMTTLSLSHAPLDSLKASFVELGWVSVSSVKSAAMMHFCMSSSEAAIPLSWCKMACSWVSWPHRWEYLSVSMH